MQDHFDVIIVGAGPAGLQCARTLVPSGKSVLILERKKVIGPKPCGGGLTYQDEAFGIPAHLTRSFPTQVIRVGRHDTVIHLCHPIRAISRLDLGQYMLKELEGAPNVTVLTGTPVTEVKPDKVVTPQGSFSFTHLVGADGSDSIVRRFLRLPTKIMLGLTYDVPKLTERVLWYFNPPLLSTGYIWTFPKKSGSATSLSPHFDSAQCRQGERPSEGDKAGGKVLEVQDNTRDVTNVGVYFDPEEIPYDRALRSLHDFLASEGLPYRPETLQGSPINVLYRGHGFGNVFLAGDAAGLASALTGEGIAFALTSGEEIARRILDPGYPMPRLGRILALKHRQERMLGLLRSLPLLRTPFLRLGAFLLQSQRFQSYFGN